MNNNNKSHQPQHSLAKLSKVASPIELQSTDVIKVIQQYLQEQGLHRTLHSLQEESQITTNTVNNLDTFLKNIETGNWDRVLEDLASFRLPISKLIPLYDQIILELCELEEFDTASTLLQQTPVLAQLKRESPDRYDRLQRFVTNMITDPNHLYDSTTKKSKRANIAQVLATEVVPAPKGRLLQIISHSLRYQQFIGALPQHATDYSIFTDNTSTQSIENQRPVSEQIRQISLSLDGDIDVVNTMMFSYNGKYLITGNDKGIIEVWDIDTGKPTKDLDYQRNNEYMMHFHPITTLSISHDNEVLATGAQNGDVKIWAFYSGECLIDLKQAHAGAITHLKLTDNGLGLITASDDNVVKVWDLTTQINTSTIHIDNTIAFISYPSMNLSTLNSNYILVLDTEGLFYLFVDNDLIIKKQLYTSALQSNAAQTLAAAAAAAAAATSSSTIDKNNDFTTALVGANRNNSKSSSSSSSNTIPVTLHNASAIPIRPDVLMICSKNDHAIHTINDKTGDVISSYTLANYGQESSSKASSNSNPTNPGNAISKSDLVQACTSALSRYIYGITTNNHIVVFNFENGKVESVFNPHDSSLVLAMCHHPHRNLLVTASADGFIRIWK